MFPPEEKTPAINKTSITASPPFLIFLSSSWNIYAASESSALLDKDGKNLGTTMIQPW